MTTSYQSNIWKLCVIRLLSWMFFFSAILVPFFTEWGKLTLSEIFILNAWFFFWNFVLEVPTGTVADFFGRKASLALGCVMGLAASLLYIVRPDFRLFLLAEVVFAVSYTLHSGADEALAYDSLLAHDQAASSKRVLARMEAFKLGGIITGTLAGGFIAATWGLRAPMIAYVAPAAAAFLLALTLKEPPVTRPAEARKSYRAILIDGGRYFLQHKILLLLAADMAITNALAWGIIWLFQPLLMRAGVELRYFGLVQAVACVTQILLLSSVERVEAWLGSKRRLLVWGSVLTGAAFLLLGASQALPLVVLGIVVAFTFGLTRVPIFSSYLNKYIPSDKRATVLSMTSMLRTLAIVIMNPLTGFLAERWLSWTLLALGAALVVFPVFSRVEERHLLE